jgi:hypothetical protein
MCLLIFVAIVHQLKRQLHGFEAEAFRMNHQSRSDTALSAWLPSQQYLPSEK